MNSTETYYSKYKIYKFRYLILISLALLPILVWLKFYAQEFFFFAPDKVNYDSPKRKNFKYEDIYFNSIDGTKLHAWFIPAQQKITNHQKSLTNLINAKATIIHFHGNSQNISSNWQIVEWLPQHGYNVFVFDYRAYGKSQGKISLNGVYEDGTSAINYLRSRSDIIDINKIFVLGQSLGVSVALNGIIQSTLGLSGIKGIVLEGGFYSYSQISEDYYKYSSLFVNDNYSPTNFIDKVSPVPLMIMHGMNDKLIKPYHGDMLYAKAKEPKSFVAVKGGHIKAFFLESGDTYQKIMLEFLDKNLKN